MARSEALKAVTYTEITLPISGHKICAGFPSPADDYLDENIDLARLLCQNQPATFLMWVSGNSMKDAGIYNGDLLVVDRSLKPTDGDVVVAVVDGLCSVKRLKISKGPPQLLCENEDYPPYLIDEQHVEIWGVVKCNVHWLREPQHG